MSSDVDTDAAGDDGLGSRFSGVQIAAAVVGIVIVAFIVLLATRDVQTNDPNTVAVGEGVPDVAGVSYDGSTFDINDVLAANRSLPPDQQEWVVVNFFASWCVPCEIEHPELIRLDEQGAACPTRLVGVAINDTEEGVRDFFDRRGGEWPVLVGDTSSTIIDFGVTAPPETFVVAPSGLVLQKFISNVTYEDVVENITC